MRKSMILPLLSLVMLLVACKPESEKVFTAIAPDYNGSKDYVNSTASNSYVCWSDGDSVNINGTRYRVAVDVVNGDNQATVVAEGVSELGGYYYASYPARQVASVAAGSVVFTLPEESDYVVSGGKQEVGSLMVAATQDRMLNFENVGSMLQFHLKSTGAGAKLCAIEVESSEPLSGDITATYSGSSWTVTNPATGSHVRRLLFPQTLELTSTAQDFYMIVPAIQNASSFTVRYYFECSNGEVKVFEKTKSSAVSLAQGHCYDFGECTFTGSAVSDGNSNSYSSVSVAGTESNPYMVYSTQSYKYYARTKSVNTSAYIALNNDISVDTTIALFKATLDGRGHTVTLAANKSLFGTVDGGKVKNLEVEAVAVATNPILVNNCFGFIACSTSNAAAFINCVNRASVEYTTNNSVNACYVGGLVGNALGTPTFTDCTNYGNVTSKTTHAGGIAGQCKGTVTGCINRGSITMIGYGCGQHKVGGLIGEQQAAVEDCANYGTVSILGTGGTSYSYLGGLFGLSSRNVTSCNNQGLVYSDISASSGDIYIGGVSGSAGVSTSCEMINCYNSVNVNVGHSQTKVYCGGLVGLLGACSVKNCYALCDVYGNTSAGIVCKYSSTKEVLITKSYWYGTATASSNTGAYGIIREASNADRVTVSFCYYPDGYGVSNSNITAINNGQLKSYLLLTDDSPLVEKLNENRPAGGCEWAVVNGRVVFKP